MPDLNLPVPDQQQDGRYYSFASTFEVSASIAVDGLLFYRLGTSTFPTNVYIASSGATDPLVTVGPAPVTWQELPSGWWYYPLPAPVTLTPGPLYYVTMYGESTPFTTPRSGTQPVPDSPFVWVGPRYQSGNVPKPNTTYQANVSYSISVISGSPGQTLPDPDPDPNAGTFHEAAIWLQFGNPNLRADSLAKLIYDYLGGLGNVIAQIDASTVNLPPLLQTLTSTWLQARQADIAAILAEVDNLQAHVVGASGGGGSAFYGPTGVQVAAGVEQLLAGAGRLGWADGDVLATAAHSLADTLPFVGQVGWGSGYALHRIHFDTSDDKHPLIDLGAAGAWIPGIGWWAPMLPDGSLGRRTVCEFQDQWCWPVPSAAVGLVLWVHPSVTGTIEAYAVPAVAP